MGGRNKNFEDRGHLSIDIAKTKFQKGGLGGLVAIHFTCLYPFQIVTNIAAIEEQLHTFTEMVEMIGSNK